MTIDLFQKFQGQCKESSSYALGMLQMRKRLFLNYRGEKIPLSVQIVTYLFYTNTKTAMSQKFN